MALTLDLSPTLLDLAGIDIPPAVQGRTLTPLLREGPHPWRTEWLHEHHFGNDRPAPIPANEGIRTEQWKYFRYVNREPLHEELYDLETDPFERKNLIGAPEHQQRAEALRERWRIWRERVAPWDETREERWMEPV